VRESYGESEADSSGLTEIFIGLGFALLRRARSAGVGFCGLG